MNFTFNHATWWLWLGLALLVLEVLTTSFGYVFFGVSALLVALLCWQFGLDSIFWETVLFAALGVAMVPLFRQRVMRYLNHTKAVSIDAGKEFVITSDLAPKAEGSTEYQGVPWTVLNDSAAQVRAGDRVVIKSVDGIRLVVGPVDQKAEIQGH